MPLTDSLPTKSPAQIFIVDDHPIVREGLSALIAAQPELKICGEASEESDALTRIVKLDPDLIVVDLSLKSGNGIDLIKRLKASNDAVRTLVWSMHAESLYAERVLRAGALGYLHKSHAAQEIINAIRTVLKGKIYLSPEASAKLLSRIIDGNHKQTNGSPIESLTDRELETFELFGRGLTTRQIAEKMHASPKTIETYRVRIKEKLKLNSGVELTRRAMQWSMQEG